MATEIDPKRTVKARKVHVFDADGGAPNGIAAEPGACQQRDPYSGESSKRLMFACPGCADWGSIRCGNPKPAKSPSWEIVSGTLDDPEHLTLSPSIHCISCCGWHGHLIKGVFESC